MVCKFSEHKIVEKSTWSKEDILGMFFPLLFANLTVRPLRTLVRDHEHFIPSKFRKHPLSSSVVNMVKADYVFPYIYMH